MALRFTLNTWEKHIARELYSSVTLVLIAFLMLFGFFDLIHELESINSNSYPILSAVLHVALQLPGRAYELFPIAVLIGSLFALTLLARHSEITVLRAAGASTAAFLAALIKIGMVFVVLAFVLGEFVVPPAERAAQRVRVGPAQALVAQEFRSGLWVKDDRAFVNAREVTPEAVLRDVRIFQFSKDYDLESISEAREGVSVAQGEWEFSNVVQTRFSGDHAQIEKLPTMSWKSALSSDILSVLSVSPDRMAVDKLYRYIRHLQSNNQKTDRYEIALWKKIIYPLAAIVMMALALPFAYLQDRMGAVSVKVFAGIMLGVGFHMLNGLFSSLGVINSWPPFFSAITPSLIFMLAAATMLWWVERR